MKNDKTLSSWEGFWQNKFNKIKNAGFSDVSESLLAIKMISEKKETEQEARVNKPA